MFTTACSIKIENVSANERTDSGSVFRENEMAGCLESLPVLTGIYEAADHMPRVARIRVNNFQPVEIQGVRIPPQITEILHYHKCLIIVFIVNFRALCNLPQHLRARQCTAIQRTDKRLLIRQGYAGSTAQVVYKIGIG